MKKTKADKRYDWATPMDLFHHLAYLYGPFKKDVCAQAWNAKCEFFITPEEDGLSVPWGACACWCNPPYDDIDRWVHKAIEESHKGARVVMLLPSRTGTEWFRTAMMYSTEIVFLRGRVRFQTDPFERPKGSGNFDSIVVLFDGDELDIADTMLNMKRSAKQLKTWVLEKSEWAD
jgi:site-specific DNA-methyltransferase (adenine-specific)